MPNKVPMPNLPFITVTVAWDPEAKVWYTQHSELPRLKLEADTIDELRDKLPAAIEDLTGKQIPFELINPLAKRA
jgi:hypothetical protein